MDATPKKVAPTNQMTKELIQQQLVPMKNATALPINAFL